MLFLNIFKHSPESCPMHNEKTKKVTIDLMANMDKLTKKYGIKTVGSWHSFPTHTVVAVYDAPSMEAMMKFSMEPVILAFLAYNHSEMLPVTTVEEGMKLLK
jgi:uncharacterized protein with GYD domain